jgi:hypothetical protein
MGQEAKMNLEQEYRLCEDTNWRLLDDEVIILDFNSGEYFSLNETGTDIFLAIKDNKPLNVLLESQQKKFGKTEKELKKDIDDLLEELLQNNIIKKSE